MRRDHCRKRAVRRDRYGQGFGLVAGNGRPVLRVLHRLIDGGHSVVVIEHDLDVIAEADGVIDLGPEGGVKGVAVVAR